MKTKMNKNISLSLVLFLVIFLTGCDNYFDVGNNPNLITNPNINTLLSTATHKAAINSYNYASVSSYYAQYLANPSEAAATDIYEITNQSGIWNASYYAMADLQDMLDMAEESQAYTHLGIGKILMAYNLSLVTDTWDSAPYSEAFMKVDNIAPAYDSPESLYQTIGQLLEGGIADLSRTDALVQLDGSMDLIHGGDVSAWIKTGYGLLARQKNKISKKSSYDANAVLSALDKSYKSPADDMTMGVFTGNNPWAQQSLNNASSLLMGWLSSNLMDHLNGTKYGFIDPRMYKITEITVNNDWVGTRNGRGNVGAANTIKDECYISTKSPVSRVDSPIYIMTYEELKFVEAEAAFRAGQKTRAYSAYLDGIKASMKKFEVSDADMNEFLARPTISMGENSLTLKDIFKEKYIATYLNFEAWNDARRFDYAYDGFELPHRAALPTFIRQIAIPFEELSTNSKNVPSQVSLDTPLWWDRP